MDLDQFFSKLIKNRVKQTPQPIISFKQGYTGVMYKRKQVLVYSFAIYKSCIERNLNRNMPAYVCRAQAGTDPIHTAISKYTVKRTQFISYIRTYIQARLLQEVSI